MTHRNDIQGLRAVAVLLVALGHAGVAFLQGGYVGVDVFFVVSGFVITGILAAEAERHGSVSLRGFYLRRARRILPAAALTLVVTNVAAHHLLNVVRAREVANDSIWTSFFAANVHFAHDQSDYFARAQPPSPLLHFWTLSVEEQFYVVWPSVVCVVLAVAIARRGSFRHVLFGVVGVASLLSLAWSIHAAHTAAAGGYYSTLARGWELGLGAALALAPRALKLPKLLGWVGLAAIAAAAALFSSETAFPGYAALLPAGGTALVIAVGTSGGVGRLLSFAPLRYVGDRSYAFYLWHWPVLAIAVEYAGHDLSVTTNLLLLGGAFALSIASYALFENPIRRLRPATNLRALAWPATAAAMVAVSLPVLNALDRERFDAVAAVVRSPEAAAATVTRPAPRPLPAVASAVRAAVHNAPLPSPLAPAPARLRGDLYSFPDGCSPGRHETSSKICTLGVRSAKKMIAVIGDSHAEMWMPSILAMAKRDRWAVVPFVKVSCIPRKWSSGDCRKWLRWAKKHASDLRPEVTLIIGSWMATWAPERAIAPVGALARAMLRSSATVLVMGDVPGQARDPTDCVLASHATMRTCSSETKPVALRVDQAIAANADREGAGFVEPLGWFCGHARPRARGYLCPLVVTNTITCVDRGHVSQTYARQVAVAFRRAFRAELFR